MRSQISDADLIYLTDSVFQRVLIRQIQVQIEAIESKYKHIFNKIEQEMEQNAEDDYGSEGDGGNPEVAHEQFSNEQLSQDRKFVTDRMSALKKQQ